MTKIIVFWKRNENKTKEKGKKGAGREERNGFMFFA